jgi:hypothetical protein
VEYTEISALAPSPLTLINPPVTRALDSTFVTAENVMAMTSFGHHPNLALDANRLDKTRLNPAKGSSTGLP